MPCCCVNTLDLCKRPVCGTFDLGVTAQMEGLHKLVIDYLDVQITLEETFELDEDIVFDISTLNENFQYTGELYDPSGTKILIPSEGTDYDCVRFKTVVNISTVTIIEES